jgi:hypothetical protein
LQFLNDFFESGETKLAPSTEVYGCNAAGELLPILLTVRAMTQVSMLLNDDSRLGVLLFL